MEYTLARFEEGDWDYTTEQFEADTGAVVLDDGTIYKNGTLWTLGQLIEFLAPFYGCEEMRIAEDGESVEGYGSTDPLDRSKDYWRYICDAGEL